MAIGEKALCIQDMEVYKPHENVVLNFKEGIYYLIVPQQDGLYVVDRKHNNFKITDKIFNKHFKQ